MSTSIRIEESDKDKLRDLQEQWRRARGEHASQQELLSHALDYLQRHWDDFVRETSWKPLAPAQINHLRRRLLARMGRDASREIDQTVYGGGS